MAYALVYYVLNGNQTVIVATPILVSLALYVGLGLLAPERSAAADDIIDTVGRRRRRRPHEGRHGGARLTDAGPPPAAPDNGRADTRWHRPRSRWTACWRSRSPRSPRTSRSTSTRSRRTWRATSRPAPARCSSPAARASSARCRRRARRGARPRPRGRRGPGPGLGGRRRGRRPRARGDRRRRGRRRRRRAAAAAVPGHRAAGGPGRPRPVRRRRLVGAGDRLPPRHRRVHRADRRRRCSTSRRWSGSRTASATSSVMTRIVTTIRAVGHRAGAELPVLQRVADGGGLGQGVRLDRRRALLLGRALLRAGDRAPLPPGARRGRRPA